MTPSHPTVRPGGRQRSVSEITICLNPLVRTTPNIAPGLAQRRTTEGWIVVFC
ncbi:hypothetical protein HanPSC8_Chr17g0775261 [Helianthus annuus]|nr:hypothetical protein HanPSC8_Chr17g0775261 [Helianthus annuus]